MKKCLNWKCDSYDNDFDDNCDYDDFAKNCEFIKQFPQMAQETEKKPDLDEDGYFKSDYEIKPEEKPLTAKEAMKKFDEVIGLIKEFKK
jgi:hypothetical protein